MLYIEGTAYAVLTGTVLSTESCGALFQQANQSE